MTAPYNNPNYDATQLKLEVIVSEDDCAIYVKITGFDTIEEADGYADHLTETLPLMLFESEVK
ncbi:MAG: hypothetical protein RLZZ196_1851, partial [Bacteroidota bacterium]